MQITNLTRNKSSGWRQWNLSMKFADVIGEDIIELFYKDTGRLK